MCLSSGDSFNRTAAKASEHPSGDLRRNYRSGMRFNRTAAKASEHQTFDILSSAACDVSIAPLRRRPNTTKDQVWLTEVAVAAFQSHRCEGVRTPGERQRQNLRLSTRVSIAPLRRRPNTIGPRVIRGAIIHSIVSIAPLRRRPNTIEKEGHFVLFREKEFQSHRCEGVRTPRHHRAHMVAWGPQHSFNRTAAKASEHPVIIGLIWWPGVRNIVSIAPLRRRPNTNHMFGCFTTAALQFQSHRCEGVRTPWRMGFRTPDGTNSSFNRTAAKASGHPIVPSITCVRQTFLPSLATPMPAITSVPSAQFSQTSHPSFVETAIPSTQHRANSLPHLPLAPNPALANLARSRPATSLCENRPCGLP